MAHNPFLVPKFRLGNFVLERSTSLPSLRGDHAFPFAEQRTFH
jgi:hypothetical protein